MPIASVAQFTAPHATKYHSFGYVTARGSGYLFDVRNGPDASDQVFTVDYQGAVACDGDLTVGGALNVGSGILFGDDEELYFGAHNDYWLVYNNSGTQFLFRSSDVDGAGADGTVFSVQDGTDDVVFVGGITAATFTGTASLASTVTVADESSDTTCFPAFFTAASGSLAAKTDTSNLTYNANTGALSCTSLVGALTGNASTATALQTARNIGGVSFNGTAAIVPGTITAANEATDTSCFVAFFLSATGTVAPKTNAGLAFNSNTAVLTATGFAGPLTGNVTGNVSGSSGSCTGLSATATALATARDINGVSFNGSANITVTAAAGTLTGNTLKSTVLTSSLTSVGTIGSLVATTADINGGTIDATAIGGGTPAAGAFTTGSFTGDLKVDAAGIAIIEIDRGTTGSYGVLAFQTAGSDSWDLYMDNTATPDMILYSYGVNAAVVTFDYATGASTFAYPATFSSTLGATAITGSGILSTTDATDASSATVASLKTAGGIACVKGLWVGTTSRLVGNVGIGQAAGSAPLEVSGADDLAKFTSSLEDVNFILNSTFGTEAGKPALIWQADGVSKAQAKWNGTNLAFTLANITMSGTLSTTDATDASSATAASLKTAGGIACVKSAWIGANLNVAGTGPHAIGGAVDANHQLLLAGNFTSNGSTLSAKIEHTGTLTLVSGSTNLQAGMYLNSDLVTQTAAEDIDFVAQLALGHLGVTTNLTGGKTIDIGATLYIIGNPTGTIDNKYGIYVGNTAAVHFTGTGYFGGNVGIGQAAGAVALMVTETAADHVMQLDNQHASTPYGIFLDFSASAPNNQVQYFLQCTDSGSARLHIWSDGSILSDLKTADTKHIELRSTGDVAHGMTDFVNTATYGVMQKVSGNDGGLEIQGYTDTSLGLLLVGRGVTDITTKATNSSAYNHIVASKKTGTSVGAVGADANLLVIANHSTTRFIFDAEGSAHADVEWIPFAAHDDVLMLRDLEATMVPDLFGKAMKYNRGFFESVGILHDVRREPDGMMRGMLNQTRLGMLHTGAICQVADEVTTLKTRIKDLETEVELLKAA